jgi:hypothetical protein
LQDDSSASEKIDQFNRQLEKYRLEASSTEGNISSMIRIEVSVADGILRAVKEKLITKVIIGWNGKLSASNFILGSLLEKLIEKANSMMMIVKIDKPLEYYKSIKMFIPPDMEYEPGFEDCLNTFRHFSMQLKKEIEYFGEQNTLNFMKKELKKFSRINSKFKFQEYSKWNSFYKYSRDLQDNELLIFMNARTGSFVHHSYLGNIPRILTRFYKSKSFVLVYPEIKVHVEDTLSSRLG